MKNLNLTLTALWFNMIEQGIKPEEYRGMKPYWIKRLADSRHDEEGNFEPHLVIFKHYDTITFTNGYGAHRPQMVVECLGISIGQGKHEWGAPMSDHPLEVDIIPTFIIHLGTILSRKNIIK